MEPVLRSAQVLKQEAEDIGFEGKDILEYVKEQQKLDREERAAWRNIRIAELQAEEKKRADELQAEEKKRADEIRFAQIKAEKELKIKEMELQAQQAQAQVTASSATTPPPRNKDAKSPKLPSFIDEKDELDSYLLRFERYAENASWEKDTWAIKLSALLTGRAMDVYTRMSDADASDYDKLKKALLTRYNYTEDGYRKRFREATPETEETPDQFVIRLKNYLAKWLELSGSSPQNFDALVDLIVKEQFINACSEDLAMYLLERGPKDLVELTSWAQKYLIAHKEQLGKSKATVQPRRVDQKKTTQSKPDSSQGRQRLLQCYRCRGFGHRQSECGTKISPGKDQKGSSTPVSQSSQKKTRAMVAQLDEDGEKAFTCVEVEGTRSKRSFLGLVGYYRDHIPAFAEISAPLTDLLKKGKAKHIQWSEAQERAYSLLKEYLLQEPVLKLPDLSKPFVLRTDASGVGVVAMLLQENDGKLYPVGYASKKLNLTEARCPIIKKECLAVVWGIKRFKLYLAGRRFTLQTDHKPLKYLKEVSYQNDRVFRWAVAVQEYSFRVEDIPGRENIGADFLSRTGYSCWYVGNFSWFVIICI